MPLSKSKNKERMKSTRVQPNIELVQPKTFPTEVKGSTLEYPALLYALADPVKREKLNRICQSLSDHNVLKSVRYGCHPMDVVQELLTAF